MEAAGERLGGEPGERDVQRVRGRFASAEVDEKAEIVMLVGLEVLPLERGGDVPGDELALPLRVLRGHSGHRTRSRDIGHRSAVSAGEHVRVARDHERLVHLEPPPVRR